MATELKDQLSGKSAPEVFFGTEGFVHLSTLDEIDTVISAMAGAAGLLPTYEAVKAGKNIALANKETMVMAGATYHGKSKETGSFRSSG